MDSGENGNEHDQRDVINVAVISSQSKHHDQQCDKFHKRVSKRLSHPNNTNTYASERQI